jgi:hypothetical protein
LKTLGRIGAGLAGPRLIHGRYRYARATRSDGRVFAMVQQSLALEARVAEVAVRAVEAVAASRLTVAGDVCQTGSLIHGVALCQIGPCGETLPSVSALLAATMRLLLFW